MNINSRPDRLAELYQEMWTWGRRHDPMLARRKLAAIDTQSRLFIVGEAHAEKQVRLSGVNWFNEAGAIGQAGHNLEAILNCVGYTVHPPERIHVGDSWVTPRAGNLNTVYTTDILPCFPPNGRPTDRLVRETVGQRFLHRELAIIQPKVILLLGDKSYKTFYRFLLHREPTQSITAMFAALSPDKPLAQFDGVTVVPFLHPSGQSGHFMKWYKTARSSLRSQPQIATLAKALDR